MAHGQAAERAPSRLRHRAGAQTGHGHGDDLHGARDRAIHGRTPHRDNAVRRACAWGRPWHHRGLSLSAPDGSGRRRALAASLRGLAAAVAAASLATPAAAHGFGQRYDLPIPLSFYLTGAAAAVVVSFVVVGLFVREAPRVHLYPRIDLTATPLGRWI